jgi:hypothetical protein
LTTIDHTPHLAFVKAYAGAKKREQSYIEYLDRQFRSDNVAIEQMVIAFEEMIDAYKAHPQKFRLLTRATRGGKLTLLDGAHRAALMRGLGGDRDVECAVSAG